MVCASYSYSTARELGLPRLFMSSRIQQQKLIAAMKLSNISSFAAQFERLSLTTIPLRPLCVAFTQPSLSTKNGTSMSSRSFTSTAINAGNWLLPTKPEAKRSRKGRPRVPTGGSARGTTLVWGDFGLRMCDHHRRVSAAQLKNGEDAIKIRLKGMRYRLYKRVCASIGVYSSGNEVGNFVQRQCKSLD